MGGRGNTTLNYFIQLLLEFIFKEFLEVFKNEDRGFQFFGKGQIFMPFSALTPPKLEICV